MPLTGLPLCPPFAFAPLPPLAVAAANRGAVPGLGGER